MSDGAGIESLCCFAEVPDIAVAVLGEPVQGVFKGLLSRVTVSWTATVLTPRFSWCRG